MLPYELFDSELHRQWKKDRALRQRVPLHEAWRGCVGFASLIEGLDDLEWHGEHALYRNEQATWLLSPACCQRNSLSPAGAARLTFARDAMKRLKQLEEENRRLKRAVAELTLDKQVLKEANEFLGNG